MTTTVLEAEPTEPPPPSSDPSGAASPLPEGDRPGLFARQGPEALLALAAFAFFAWGLSKNGYGNSYYAAAVRSATTSWKAWFYGSLDPGSWITVDKPPLALWVQGLSARAFGYSSWSLLLPSAATGAATVALLTATVRRVGGRAAGLSAGAVLALTPIFLAVSRSNNPDVTLVFCVVAAAYATQRAISERKPWWLVLAGVFCGLAFLAKLLVAGFVMPGIFLAYALTGPGRWTARLRDLVGCGLAFLGVALGWVALVDLTPASDRPFIGGSTNGKAGDLVFGYNGLGRITGNSGPGGGGGPGGGRGFGGGGGIDQFGGATGIGRLFNNGMGDQVMWIVAFAVAALLLGLGVAIHRRRRDAETGALVMWGTWAVLTYVVFAYADGIFHNYYVSLLAPALAALCGLGVAQARRHVHLSAAAVGAAALISASIALVLLKRVDAYPWMRTAIPVGLFAVAVVALVVALNGPAGPVTSTRLAVGALAIAMVPSAIWAWNGTQQAQSGTFPDARPGVTAGFGGPGGAGGGPGGFGGGLSTAELNWLKGQRTTEKWLLAVSSSMQADSALINGDSVMAMGGFSGNDPAMTAARLATLVEKGQLRFISGGGGFGGGFGGPGGGPGGGGTGAIIAAQVCTPVSATNWGGTGDSGIYDCRGKAAQIRATAG